MIWKSYILLLLALLTWQSEADMDNHKVQNVIGASVFRKGQMVKEGSLVRLTCRTERPWFFCLWQSPGEDRQCAINLKETEPETVCKGKRLALQGTQKSCNLQIKAEPSDHGAWMCLVTYDDNFDTSKVFIDLEVAVEASLAIEFNEVEEQNHSLIQESVLHKKSKTSSVSTDSEEDIVLHIDEGQEKSVTCLARRAFPRSQLSWTLNNSTSSDLDNSSQAIINFYEDNHWVDTTQTAKLTGRMKNNNSSLQCWSKQISRSGQVVFVQSSSIRINVHPVGAPLILTKTSENIGLLILLIFLLVIVMFLCIVLAIPSCRKRKRKEEEKRRETIHNGVPTESSRRRASYDQNRNKLRVKREPFGESILKAEELLDQAFEDTSEDRVVINGAPKTSSMTFSERGIDIPSPSYILADSQKTASKSPYRAESQKSIYDSFFRTESKMSPSNSPSRAESQMSPSKSSSRASLSASLLNPVISRVPDANLDDTAAPIDHVNVDHAAAASPQDDLREATTHSDHDIRDALPVSTLRPSEPPDAKDSVFYCQEGCFNLSSPCTHMKVAIPRSTIV